MGGRGAQARRVRRKGAESQRSAARARGTFALPFCPPLSSPPGARLPDPSGLWLAGLAAATWSLAGVWVRWMPGVPIGTVVAGRLAVSLVVLSPLLWLRRKDLGRPNLALVGLAALMGGYYVAAVAAFRLAPVAEATLFVNSSPLFAVGWALARREPLSRAQLWGTALALAGVAVIVGPGLVSGADADRQRLVGDGLALGAAALMAAYSVAFQRLGERAPSPLLATAAASALGAIALAALVTVRGADALAGLDSLRPQASLVGLAVVTTAVPTLAYSTASHRLPAVVVTTTRLLTPAFAAVAAYAMLGEVPSAWLIPGGGLVVGGLVLSLRR